MIMVFIALLLPAILGFLAIAVLLKKEEHTSLLERLCLAYPLGTGLLTIQMFLLGLLRVPLTWAYTTLPVMVEILVLSLWVLRNKTPLVPKISYGLVKDIASAKTNWTQKAVLIVLTLWAAVKLASIFIETGTRPIWAWDSWSDWSVGAKLFYHTKSLLLDTPTQDFFGRGVVTRLTAYPLLNTLMQTWISIWNGGFDEVLVKFWTPVFLLSIAGYLYSFACKELNRLTAMALLVIFLSSPLMSYHAVEVYSDLPLGVYLGLASASFLHAMRGRRSYWRIVGLFSAIAMFTKDEALFFIAPLFLSAAYFLWRNTDDRITKKNTAMQLLSPLLFVAPWYIFKIVHHLGIGADSTRLIFSFHPEVIVPAIQQMASLENFNVFLVFFPLFLLAAGKPDRELLHILFALACYVLFFIMLYCFTNDYYDHFFRGTVFFRNILTYYPLIALLTAVLLKKQPILEHASPVKRKHGKRKR